MEKRPIFIHSLFRTGSTYLWNKFRQSDRYRCYYEPLHQVMGKLTPENIDFMMTRDFNSVHHPELKNYYLHEYKSLLKGGQSGIPYFKKEFSYDQFCMNEQNPDLKQYIDYLVGNTGEKTPVLKFNRTAFRGKWFKQNFPDSLNIYLVRNPRDQWQSYYDLYRRTDYDGFFLMDLIIASLNKDRRDFLPLSENIPLVSFRHPQQDTENDFYRVALGIYPDEEKYFIFYYTWFNAFIKNVLHGDLVIDINRLTADPVYNNEIKLFLKGCGIEDMDFGDADIEEYSSYALSPGIMAKIEEEVRQISLPSFTGEQLDLFFEKMVPGECSYFPFKKKYFLRLNKREVHRTHESVQTRIEKMEKLVDLFQEGWFDQAKRIKKLESLATQKAQGEIDMDREIEFINYFLAEKDVVIYRKNAELLRKDLLLAEKEKEIVHREQLLKMERHLERVLNSWTYRTGKAVVFPLKLAADLVIKSPARFKGFSRDMAHQAASYFSGYEKRIDLADQLEVDFGQHRSGLKYGLRYLKRLQNPGETVLDAFIERTFCWHPRGIEPHTTPWIGFIHVPPHMPGWFFPEQANEMIFRTEAWKKSLPNCRGLFTMSLYHRKYLETKTSVRVNNLIFPTEIPRVKWSWEKFRANREKKIIQVGWWLRRLHAIYQLPANGYKKIFLSVGHQSVPRLLQTERELLLKDGTFDFSMYKTAETVDYLPAGQYDRLLSENIVFVYLYDASANNTVTECIARNTPLLINPIEPVREYLGADYPFYYNSLEEAAAKALDFDLIYRTHRYLANHPIKKKLSGEYFLESFVNSEIYRSLIEHPEKEDSPRKKPQATHFLAALRRPFNRYEKKIDLSSQLEGFYGQHRSGWPYVLSLLQELHNPRGILLDSFIERTFCWHPGGIKANLRPWIGFIHIPPNVPPWFQNEQSNDFIFASDEWKESLPFCRGLMTLSNYHRKSLEKKLSIPINNFIFPTEIPGVKWSFEKFQANKEKKIVQVGWWLRKLHTIYQLPATQYKKIFLKVTHTDLNSLLKKEREILLEQGQFKDEMYKTAESATFISNDDYDRLLAENIIIINLYDSSANNTVIECLARNTPLLVNPIEPVKEYLGEDYPFYFTSLEEAAAKAEDLDLIYRTYSYLLNHPLKEKLKGEYFLKSFVNSPIYKDLEV